MVLALLSPACGRPDLELAPGEPRNLILLSIDTLRADHLGCYGYDRETSPALDRLAASGVLFEEVTSSAPWTVPAHMSMLTGLYPRTHGVVDFRKELPKALTTLAEHLLAQGFATAGMVNAPMMRKVGFPRGFESYEYQHEPPRPDAPEILAAALDWMQRQGDRRFFLFLHLYDVHSDYSPGREYKKRFERPYGGAVRGINEELRGYCTLPAEERTWSQEDAEHLIDLYDAEIRQLDDTLAEFFGSLRSSGLLDRTVLAVTSDHGEEFLEHAGVLHGPTLHTEVLRVPLLLVGPAVPRGARFPGAASPVDLFPTFTSLLAVPAPPGLEGTDLTRAWREHGAWPRERAVFAETSSWIGSEEDAYRVAIRRGDYALHYDREREERRLYHRHEDPGEHRDVAGREPERLRELSLELEAFLEELQVLEDTRVISPEEAAELEALGY